MKNGTKYIDEVLSQRWKKIKCGSSVEVNKWDDNMEGFVVDMGSKGLVLYSFKEFFNEFVIESNERIWDYADESERIRKNSAGWLCVMNGISIFNKFEGECTHKESMVLATYVRERIDDVHYSTKNNLLPPWLEEEAVF